MRYAILYARKLEDLERKVNVNIHRGWKPIGGVSMSQYEGVELRQMEYSQAMIQESPGSWSSGDIER
jgi:hypothetical protein